MGGMKRIVILTLLGALGCAPGAALKAAVKNSTALSGARALTVVGSEDDAFAMANSLRKKGFTVSLAKDKREVTSGFLLEVAGCCPNAMGMAVCDPLNADLFQVEKGQKVFAAVIDDASDCPARFFTAVADELGARWQAEAPAAP
jgi:hypothetical protein